LLYVGYINSDFIKVFFSKLVTVMEILHNALYIFYYTFFFFPSGENVVIYARVPGCVGPSYIKTNEMH